MRTSTTTSPAPMSTPLSLDLHAARQLRDGLASLLRAERTAAADFLLALSDFDRRRGWEPLGHASLFAFLRVELGLSKGGAFFRQTAARLLHRFPDLIEPLRDGRLCITTVVELAKVLTEANQANVLPRFYGCSSQEAKEVVAELVPMASPPVRPVVTAVVSPRLPVPERPVEPQAALVAAPSDMPLAVTGQVQSTEPLLTHPARASASRDDVEPLTADLRRLHVTVTKLFLEKLSAARDGLSHAIPGATTEQVLDAALDLLLEKQVRARGLVKRPRMVAPVASPASTPTPTPTSTPASAIVRPKTPMEPLHRRPGPRKKVPADVRRAVWERDQGRCVWPLDSGGVCGSTHQVEVDHSAVPWARGGQATLANLRLLCHPHNKLAAKLAFGARCVERYGGTRDTRRRQAATAGSPDQAGIG